MAKDISQERYMEITASLAAFMRSLERLKDFRNYFQKALAMGLTVDELSAYIGRVEYERASAEARRNAWQAQFKEKMERCPHHPERPAMLRIVPDTDGIVLACPLCRWSRYQAGTTPHDYLAGRGIETPQRRQSNGKA